jgi:integrase
LAGLTDTRVRNAKPTEKTQRLYDSGGLYLEIPVTGGKLWRVKFRFGGKEKRLALGSYPAVTLADARHGRDDAKVLLSKGVDPSAEKKSKKINDQLESKNTFELIAREWLAKQKKKLAVTTFDKAQWTFETLVFPWLGQSVVSEITPPELLAILRRIEARGAYETAHRTKARCGQVFRYAIATGRATRDPSADLRGALEPVVSKNFAAITDAKRVGELLRAIDSYTGQYVTRCALQFAPLVFVRPSELRKAVWTEFDLKHAQWRIPAERMKMREEHIVPLSKQAVKVLQDLHPLTGKGVYLFPSLRAPKEPMSENTVNAALRRMGYSKDEMTGHGFRAMASTRLNEMGFEPDVIERQLAHAERNKVRAAYNRAQYLSERIKMMQWWADYLVLLKTNGEVLISKKKTSTRVK